MYEDPFWELFEDKNDPNDTTVKICKYCDAGIWEQNKYVEFLNISLCEKCLPVIVKILTDTYKPTEEYLRELEKVMLKYNL